MSREQDRPAASFFSLPLAYWQQPHSLRTATYESKRKRKLDDEEGDDEEEDLQDVHDSVENDYGAYSSRAASSVILTPDEQRQYLTAGLPVDSELPGGAFPHGPPPQAGLKTASSRKKVERELAHSSQPLFDPTPNGQRTLRLQHLAVVTTILHRCLSEGDYMRAGRAWGLILRDSVGGSHVDVRQAGRWGIGAEILLWSDQNNGKATQVQQEPSNTKQWFTRKGFERAKEYYERLILQFPYDKRHKNSTNPLHFYPAMFGLWISVTQDESREAREREIDDDEIEDAGDFGGDAMDSMSIHSDTSAKRDSARRKIVSAARARELTEAEKIATELDRVLLSPPYSDSARLLELRAMMAQWIGDLHVSIVTADDPDGMPTQDVQVSLDYRLALDKRAAEFSRAESFLQKAKRREQKGSLGLEKLHIDSPELEAA